MTVDVLYAYAEQKKIDVDWVMLGNAECLSAPLFDGSCVIAIDPTKLLSKADEKTKLAHEIGHCERLAFYNQYAAYDVRKKHENQADKWAIKKLIPKGELDRAVNRGLETLWDLAEYFGVTEDFMKKAVCYYTNGNLATDLYF